MFQRLADDNGATCPAMQGLILCNKRLSCTTLNFLTNFYVDEKPLGNDQSLKPNSILHIKAKSFLYSFPIHGIFHGYNYCISNEYCTLLYSDKEKCTMPDAFQKLSGSEVSV